MSPASPGGLKVLIVATPPGEAPLWVREKWVGLELPLDQSNAAARSAKAAGVLSGPRTNPIRFLAVAFGLLPTAVGFRVRVRDAVEILERSSPEAALWWRDHAGHLLAKDRTFLFHEHVCKVLGPSSS